MGSDTTRSSIQEYVSKFHFINGTLFSCFIYSLMHAWQLLHQRGLYTLAYPAGGGLRRVLNFYVKRFISFKYFSTFMFGGPQSKFLATSMLLQARMNSSDAQAGCVCCSQRRNKLQLNCMLFFSH